MERITVVSPEFNKRAFAVRELAQCLNQHFNAAGGHLHILLDDGNDTDEDIAWLRDKLSRLPETSDPMEVAHRHVAAAILDLIEPMTEEARAAVFV